MEQILYREEMAYFIKLTIFFNTPFVTKTNGQWLNIKATGISQMTPTDA